MEPQIAFVSNNSAQMPSLSGQTQMYLFPVASPSEQPNFMTWSEQAFNAFIESRIRPMTQPNISPTFISYGYKTPGESVNEDANKQTSESETRFVSPCSLIWEMLVTINLLRMMLSPWMTLDLRTMRNLMRQGYYCIYRRKRLL